MSMEWMSILGTADVKVIGGFPRSIFGKFTALCASISDYTPGVAHWTQTRQLVQSNSFTTGLCQRESTDCTVITLLDRGTPGIL